MPPRIEIAPELIAEAKRLYERTLVPVNDIAAMMGLSKYPFYRRVKEWGWRRRRAKVGALELVRALTDSTVLPLPPLVVASGDMKQDARTNPPALAERTAVAARIQDVVERELAAVERVLDLIGPDDKNEAELSARTLASIARTLREIAAINQPNEVTPPDEADDDPIPRDIDEFREELARRIQSFVAAERGLAGKAKDDTAGGAECSGS
jgi:hypothetical protein